MTCGGGTHARNVTCEGDEACDGLAKPPTTETCNPRPCTSYAWSVGDWGECSVSCGGGVMTRVVACKDLSSGEEAADDVEACGGPKPSSTSACNTRPCGANPACPYGCSGRGQCSGSGCACEPGWSGAACQIPEVCGEGAAQDAAGGCCRGLLDSAGSCCVAPGVLGRNGACCPGGIVDACGVCGGSGEKVDAKGSCCAAVALDAEGMCCSLGEVDACGVCGGDGTSCATLVSLAKSASSSVMDEENAERAAFISEVQAGMGEVLGLPTSQVCFAYRLTTTSLRRTSQG